MCETFTLKAHPIRYDVYLSYCPSDQQLAAGIIGKLESLYGEISIYAERQEINPDKTWQDHIYEVKFSFSNYCCNHCNQSHKSKSVQFYKNEQLFRTESS